MNWVQHLRVRLAIFHLALMWTLLANDCLFIHKHRTIHGFVIHTHPYDLSTNPGDTRHHHSNDEISWLDFVFYGSYLQPSFGTAGLILVIITEIKWLTALIAPPTFDVNGLSDLRAPPFFPF